MIRLATEARHRRAVEPASACHGGGTSCVYGYEKKGSPALL